MHKPIIFFLSFMLLTPSAVAQSPDKSIVGAWELVRYDNIKPRDTPPAGLTNTIYLFYANGKSKYFAPGQEDRIVYGRGNTPYKEYIPYRIENDTFWGWFGLTNDLEGPKSITFIGADEFEITFKDKSVALFRRLGDDPEHYPITSLVQVPFTIRGINYNKAFLQEVRAGLKDPDAGPQMKPQIIGKWIHSSKEKNIEVVMEFKENNELIRTAKRIENSIGYEPEVLKGTYRVHGDLLIFPTNPLAPVKIAIEGNTLTFTEDGVRYFTLTKVE